MFLNDSRYLLRRKSSKEIYSSNGNFVTSSQHAQCRFSSVESATRTIKKHKKGGFFKQRDGQHWPISDIEVVHAQLLEQNIMEAQSLVT